MAFSKIGGKGIDLSTDVITEFNSTGVDDNATATTITLNANNTATIPNVTGNTTFSENVTIGGDLTVTGNNFTVDSTSLKVEDSLIHLAGNNVSSDIIDIGFIGHYSNDSGNTELFTGFYRDATDEQYYLFNGLSDDINTATTIDKTGTGYTLAHLNVGGLNANGIFTIGDRGSATEELTIFHEDNVSYLISDSSAGGGSKGEFSFRTNDGGTAAERVRIDGAGKVGIGTNSPSGIIHTKSDDLGVVLQSSSNANKRMQIFFFDSVGTTTGRIGNDIGGANASSLGFISGTGTTPQMSLNTSGQVAIGQTTHSNTNVKIDLHNSGSGVGTQIAFYNDHNTGGYFIGQAGNTTGHIIYYNVANTAQDFYNNNAFAMTLSADGKLGIGITSPATNLHILDSNPVVRLQSSGAGTDNTLSFLSRNISNVGAYADIIAEGAGHNSTNAPIVFTQGSGQTERMRIDSSGNVGIGVIPNSALNTTLQIEGAFGSLSAITPYGGLYISTNDSVAADVGGIVNFGGMYNATQTTRWASIAGLKENGTVNEYGGYLVLATRTHAANGPTERMRITSTGDIYTKLSSTSNHYVRKDLPYFYLGSGGITDEYLIISRYHTSGTVVATGIDGIIKFSRGNTGAGNAQEHIEIAVEDAYTNTRVLRFQTGFNRRFHRIDIIEVDSQLYLALRAASSGGNATNYLYFEGTVIGENVDSKILTRVRQSDANVTLITSSWHHPISLQIADTNTLSLETVGLGRLFIDGAGRVTTPYQPCFRAERSGSQTYSVNQTIIFNSEIFDQGSNYNTSTGVFTAPVTGKYYFSATVLVQVSSSGWEYDLQLATSNRSQYGAPGRTETQLGTTWGNDYIAHGLNTVIDMDANDTAYLRYTTFGGGTIYGGSYWTSFGGYLIG